MIKEGDLVFVKKSTRGKLPLTNSDSSELRDKYVGQVVTVECIHADGTFRITSPQLRYFEDGRYDLWFHLCDVEKVFRD